MSTAARLGAFAVAALLALGGGYAVGAVVGPLDASDPAPAHAPTHPTPPTTAPVHGGHAGMSR